MSWFSKRHRKSQPTPCLINAVPPETTSIPQYRNGLLRLEPTTFDTSRDGQCLLDIVAIHGLNGNAYATWKGNGPLWLQEDLPGSLPGARVYTYSYNSKVWSSSKGDVRDWAKSLLACLNNERRTDEHQKRAIIFICHSLGGIVCKKALVEANEDASFSNILRCTKAIVFFGTPHVGSEQADFGSMLALIAESLETAFLTDRITGQRVRRDLVDLLKNQSKELEELTVSFRNRLVGVEIVSFYEQDTMRGFKSLIVPRNSALLNCPAEHQHPCPGKDHRTMCQISHHDTEYHIIVALCEKYTHGMSNEAEKIQTSQHEQRTEDKISEKGQKCMNALRLVEIEMMDRRAHIASPAPHTCQWILSNMDFSTWISGDRSEVLHLTGDMGSGKTTIISFLVNYWKSNQLDHVTSCGTKSFTVCSFFCSDQHHHFRDALWVLRGILYQLLEQNEPLTHSMHTSIAGLGDIAAESWNQSLLWPQLEQALKSPLAGPVLLVIDALDECDESSISLLLENIGRLLHQKNQSSSSCIKLLISSRPTIKLPLSIQPFITTLSVDTDGIFKSVQLDVNQLINYEIGRLATTGNWTRNMRTVLGQELKEKAGVSFLWTRLVLNRLEHGSQDLIHLRRVIDESPKDLDQFYCHILAGIDEYNQDLAAKMLRILVGSMRPLTSNEFRMALAILFSGSQSLELEEIELARDRNIKQSIRKVLKSLACVRGNKIQLYHVSTKEFLLRLSEGKVGNLESFTPPLRNLYGITLDAANLDLARACITFLGLDDFNEDMDKAQDDTLSMFAELTAYTDDDEQVSSTFPNDVPPSPSLSVSNSEDEGEEGKLLSVKEKIQKHHFYAYSATYWAAHLRLVGPFTTQELLESSIHISDPSENCLMHWSDVYRSSSQEWVTLPKPLDPLTISAFFGVVSLGREVLKQFPHLDEKNKSLALCWACRMGHVDVVDMLLAHDTKLTSHQPEGRWPISWACANGHLKIVERLLKENQNSQINLPDHRSRSPLSLAVEFGDLTITKLLLAIKEIDVNLPDHDGSTPIHWSVGSKMGRDDIKVLKRLLAVPQISISARDKGGRTVLSWAAEKGALEAINILLNSKHPDLSILLSDKGDSNYGRSPLSYASFYGHADVVSTLCKTGKCVTQLKSVDHTGQNAVVLAADRNNWEVIQVLARYYPEGLDLPDQDGRTALSAAMWADDNANNARTIRVLLENGVDVNSKSKSGRTPLGYAAKAGRVNMMRILVEEGRANLDVGEAEGSLPEDLAGVYSLSVREEFRRLRAVKKV